MQINGQANIWNVERKTSNNGSEYTSFSVSFSKKNQDGSYENGSLRATAHKFNHDKMQVLNDGDMVYYIGDIQPNNYEKDGQKIYGFQLFTREIHKIEKLENNTNKQQANNNGPQQFMDSDLPF